MNAQKAVMHAIAARRRAQDAKWGPQRHAPFKWLTILAEEVGEVAEAMLAENLPETKSELEDVAAVAVAALEQIHDERPKGNPPLVYLAGPIAGCTDAEAHDWRNQFASAYPHVLNPMDRDYRGREIGEKDIVDIVEGDKADIDRADIVVVWYVRPSVGTSMEVLYAWESGKPVIIINPARGPLSPWLCYHSSVVVRSVTEALFLVNSAAAHRERLEKERSPANTEGKA